MLTAQNEPYPLKPERVHEVCGPSALSFAAVQAFAVKGQVLWVKEQWYPEQLNPMGLLAFVQPEHLLTANTKTQTDTLAVSEEALRSGAVRFVVMELSAPLNLTEGRRLQIAARAGGTTGLAIIKEGNGSNAAETRWHCSPQFDPTDQFGDSTLQRWKLIKNKSGTLGVWNVRWIASSRRINVVSEAGK